MNQMDQAPTKLTRKVGARVVDAAQAEHVRHGERQLQLAHKGTKGASMENQKQAEKDLYGGSRHPTCVNTWRQGVGWSSDGWSV